mmetsp:Transcript_19577/g.55059  ORF Transcript_19577/g.55059 Transcript_19577/m.55059 type:complete len:314 (-) Transcript_19577:3550-4491(-)
MKACQVTIIAVCLLVGTSMATTTMQMAFERAFNEVVSSGEYADIFGFSGDNDGTILTSDRCPGNAEYWPWPQATKGSDLLRLLARGRFDCGYNSGADFRTPFDRSLINTEGSFTRPTGAVVTLFDRMAEKISIHYDTSFEIAWNTQYVSSDDVLYGVETGRFDAACGRYGVGATYTNKAGTTTPRAQSFSLFQCMSYISRIPVWSNQDPAPSEQELLEDLEDGATVCTPSSSGGGTEQQCTSILSQFVSDPNFNCTGLGLDAWPQVEDTEFGECTYVWGSYPPAGVNLEKQARTLITTYYEQAGTFFRESDAR